MTTAKITEEFQPHQLTFASVCSIETLSKYKFVHSKFTALNFMYNELSVQEVNLYKYFIPQTEDHC